jgi:hypothetical protein
VALSALILCVALIAAGGVGGASEVDEPGSSFADANGGNGYLVPIAPVWLGGDVTVNATVPQSGKASFELDDVNLLVRYEPLPRLAFFSETRLENTLTVSVGSGARVESSDIFIERLYVDWLVSPHLTVRVGKFLTPFGVWNEIRRAPLTWTVERPLVTEQTFPEHTTGGGIFYQATLHGWSIDATGYAPAQDELPLRSSDEAGLTLVGGRIAAAHEVGAAYLSLGLNGAGTERRGHGGLEPVAGADINLNIAGNDLLGEFVYARSPERFVDDEWGLYLQDAVPLRNDLYGIVRYEHFRSFRDGQIEVGLIGLTWRPYAHLIIKADYQLTNKPSDDVPRGLLASLSILF